MSENRRDDSEDLTLDQKIQRVQDLWDEIARDVEKMPLTPEQAAEVERRLRDYEGNPDGKNFSTWEEVLRRLRRK